MPSTHLVKVSGKVSDQPSVSDYRQLPQVWSWCLNRSLGSSRSNLDEERLLLGQSLCRLAGLLPVGSIESGGT